MSTVSAAAVKALRDRTSAPYGACKTALEKTGGDMEKAVAYLHEQNAAIGGKKAERETAEGRVGAYIDEAQKVGAVVEVRCESAPSAKNELFVKLANDIARQVALKSPDSVEALLKQPFADEPGKTVADRVNEVIGLIRENMRPARFTRLSGTLGSYVHHDGSVGVLLQVEGDKADVQMLRDVCMHITARNPPYARRDDVPKDTIEQETDIARKQAASTGKPANIAEKIAEGKMKTWYAENVLEEQPFVKDDTKTVGQLLQSAGLKLVKFIRYKVGELT